MNHRPRRRLSEFDRNRRSINRMGNVVFVGAALVFLCVIGALGTLVWAGVHYGPDLPEIAGSAAGRASKAFNDAQR